MLLRSGTKMKKQGPEEEDVVIDNDKYTVTFAGRTFNYVFMATHINILLYATCFWIQIGTLPYLSRKLGADPVTFGYLQTTFAVVQLCGGPLYGRFGDLYGGKAALVLAFSTAAMSYALLGLANTIPLLFLSRLPSVFMHAMQGGQMVVTDISKPDQRAAALGKLGMSYGIGMIIGPLIGGLATKYYGEQTAAFVACTGSVVSIVLCYIYIPVHTKLGVAKEDVEKSDAAVFSLSKIASLLKHESSMTLIIVKTISGIPLGIFQSMFSVVAMDRFNLSAAGNGYLMSYIGIMSMAVQGVGVGIVTKKFTENQIIKGSAFILIWAYLLLGFVTSTWQLCLVIIPLTIGMTLMTIVISSAITKTVDITDTGAMLGLNMAMNSLIRTVSPTVGGYMLTNLGYSSFGYFGFVTSICVTLYVFRKLAN